MHFLYEWYLIHSSSENERGTCIPQGFSDHESFPKGSASLKNCDLQCCPLIQKQKLSSEF